MRDWGPNPESALDMPVEIIKNDYSDSLVRERFPPGLLRPLLYGRGSERGFSNTFLGCTGRWSARVGPVLEVTPPGCLVRPRASVVEA